MSGVGARARAGPDRPAGSPLPGSKLRAAFVCGLIGAGALLAQASAQAAVNDEIQVYNDEINEPGGFGIELHSNVVLKGRRIPEFAGERVPHRSLFVTPELSWGVTRSLELGLYLPFTRSGDGSTAFAGPKLRLKWIGRRVAEGETGWFGGVNVEVGRLAEGFEASREHLELRPILGWRARDWEFVTNPILGWDLSRGYRGAPGFSPATKWTHRVGEGLMAGLEHYGDLGPANRWVARTEQSHTLYAVIDIDRGPWVVNLGVGRGLGSVADRWTVKMIVQLPL